MALGGGYIAPGFAVEEGKNWWLIMISKNLIARGCVFFVGVISAVLLALALASVPAYAVSGNVSQGSEHNQAQGRLVVAPTASSSNTYQGLKYYPIPGGLMVTPANKNATSVTIPAKINGKKVLTFTHTANDVYSNTLKYPKLKLKNINLKNATNLRVIIMHGTQVKSLDLSKCKNLNAVEIQGNPKLTTLKLGAKKKLEQLSCANCALKKVDVSKCPKLKLLSCLRNKKLQIIKLGANKKLKEISCGECAVKKLNLAKCTKLESLDCRDNKLTSLDTSKCPNLGYLSCEGNNIAKLNLSKNAKLDIVNCCDNVLTSLNVAGCSGLTHLICTDNRLVSINTGKCANLEQLYCYNNKLTSLVVHANLEGLECAKNQLGSLDVSHCAKLVSVSLNGNPLKSVKLPATSTLKNVYCDKAQESIIDLSGCPNATYVAP